MEAFKSGFNPEKNELEKIEEDYLLIKKSDIEKIGKRALKLVYEDLNIDYLNNENIDEEFLLEMKKLKKDLDKLILKKILKSEKKTKKVKFCINEVEDEYNDKSLKNYYQSRIKKEIENESFDTETIYNILDKINFTFFMGEDACCARNAFLKSYEVFFNCYYELEE